MESQEVLKGNMPLRSMDKSNNDLNNGCSLCDEGFDTEEVDSGVKVDLLEDLDTMMEDIDNRLRVSRMVSDSVIKGIVNAVEQEADDNIKAKELELACLKQSMQFLHVNGDEVESSWLQETQLESETIDFDGYTSFEDVFVKYDKLKGSLLVLRNSASEQLKRLKKQIESVRGCKTRNSCGILKENECESSVSIDITVENLEIMMNTMFRQVDGMIVFSKRTLRESRLEQEMKEELQATVMQSTIRCLQEEFEENLWDRNVNWAEKLDEISGLRKELDALTRLLLSSESGNLISHGSFDADKALSSQLSSRFEENGMSNEAKTDVPEKFDAAQLKHMKHEELVNFFNNRISKIKRDHESTVQQMTENYISLKRKYLSERRCFLPQSKDMEILRKKIPEVISKLDKVFVEGDIFLERGNDGNSLDCLKDRLDSLFNENRLLRNLLVDKQHEVTSLSSQVSVASEKILQLASSEANIRTLMKTLNLSMADTHIEASIMEDVYKCVIGELGDNIKCMKEESELKIVAIQDVYGVLLKEASIGTKTTNLCEIEDSSMESLFTEELSKTIFKLTLKEAEEKFEILFNEYKVVIENLSSLEEKAVGMEAEIILEVEEKERLRKEVHLPGIMIEENENIARELANEREQFELASDELNKLNGKLMKAQEQIEIDKMEIISLNQKFELAIKEIKAANDLKNNNFALTEEKQSYMSLIEAKEKEYRKQMEAVVVFIDGLSTKLDDFECKVAGDILKSNTRLENSSYQLSSLIKAANEIKITGLLYKQKLERKCSDLQMAEDEVDLLGDEVETLLDLLEKIYIALDHYSPVLQHYPGVIEILKLVRRELTGEAVKAH